MVSGFHMNGSCPYSEDCTVTDLLALITIMVWPVIPLFWIPVHGFTRFIRNIGLLSYISPVIIWIPLAWGIYLKRDLLLQFTILLPSYIIIAGALLFLMGTVLHVWTGMLLGLGGLIGLPEISSRVTGNLITSGPFSVVRHPTYLAHTFMFLGVFFMSGVLAVGIITLIDLLLVTIVIIPLEDRELLHRFGNRYKEYMESVSGYFPAKWLAARAGKENT